MASYFGRPLTYMEYPTQAISGDGVTTTFSLTYNVGSAKAIIVTIDASFQIPGSSYTTPNGTQIVFTEAPPSGTTVYIQYLGIVGSYVVPVDGSVTSAKLAPGGVTLPSGSSGVDFAMLANTQTFARAQRGQFTTLTSSAASIAINLALANNFTHTLTENTTLAAPTNVVAGQSGFINFNQHASSPKTLAFNTFWKFENGVIPSLTSTNSAKDVLAYAVADVGTYAVCKWLGDVK